MSEQERELQKLQRGYLYPVGQLFERFSLPVLVVAFVLAAAMCR